MSQHTPSPALIFNCQKRGVCACFQRDGCDTHHLCFFCRSNNNNSEFPGNPRDLYQMAGFQWYDTDVKTIITDTTFRNYPITSEEGVVWYTMVHSDQFKPMGQCASLNIKYENVQDRFLAYHQKLDTGASRFFNWIDYDGSAFRRNHSTLVGGWPSWWKVKIPLSVFPACNGT